MSIKVEVKDIKFIDSLNFLPLALSKLPGAFGLKELAKVYFPHFFNKRANQGRALSHLPDIRYYNPNAMIPAEREKFVEWYELDRGDPFDFKKEIIRYYQSDVHILPRCCLRFMALFMEKTSDDTTSGIDRFCIVSL